MQSQEIDTRHVHNTDSTEVNTCYCAAETVHSIACKQITVIWLLFTTSTIMF